jgi:hypothetical protein
LLLLCADLRRKWFQDNNECSEQSSTEGGRLRMAQAWSVFVIPAVGAAAGILIAAAEVFYYNKMFVGECGSRETAVRTAPVLITTP